MGAAFEVNKQMCDLDIPLRNPIKPLSEETAQELIGKWEKIGKEWASKKKEIVESIFGNITNEKSNIMEEKKTKKMTKAEAFEWLNNKKLTAKDDVYVNVLFKLFECGIEWVVGGQSFTYCGSDFLIIEGGKLFHCGRDGEVYWRSHHFEEISADDILSIEIVDGEDNIAEKKAFQQARDIMKWLREEQSPHTLMIIDGYHVELLDGVKAEVWKE